MSERADPGPISPSAPSPATSHIRGSSLLFAGRVLALAANFLAQVLILRTLAKTDYGAFAYVLSLVTFAQTFMSLGLDRSLPRFAPIYDEQGTPGTLVGAIIIQIGAVVTVGLGVVVAVYGLSGIMSGFIMSDGPALSLLLILILLAPIQAFDDMLVALLAVFARPGAIFFRRYVLTPGLRLAVVIALVLTQQQVAFLAAGYVAGGALAVAIYVPVLLGVLRPHLVGLRRSEIRFPVRELFTFALPVLSADVAYIVIQTSDAVLLGWFRGAEDVAAFRAVQPAAQLNQVVFASFTLLFVPAASRLFAKRDHPAVKELYWQTAVWMAVFTFPIFLLTFSLAGPLAEMLDPRYAASAPYLALLSLGYYFNAALGFNGLTLKVFGLLRYSIAINVTAAVLNILLNLFLIPAYGALGAAVGTMATLVIHNVLKQAGLRLGTGINVFEWRYLRVYFGIVAGTMVVLLVQLMTQPPVLIGLIMVAAASVIIFRANRQILRVDSIFPELLRIPGMRLLLGAGGGS